MNPSAILFSVVKASQRIWVLRLWPCRFHFLHCRYSSFTQRSSPVWVLWKKVFFKVKLCGENVIEDTFCTEDEKEDDCTGFDVISKQSHQLTPGIPYVLEARISWPSSFYGTLGKEVMLCGKVTFRFIASDKSSDHWMILNGSIVSQGQFAEIFFRYVWVTLNWSWNCGKGTDDTRSFMEIVVTISREQTRHRQR